MLGDNRHPNSDETYPSISDRPGDRSSSCLWRPDASSGRKLFLAASFAADFRSNAISTFSARDDFTHPQSPVNSTIFERR